MRQDGMELTSFLSEEPQRRGMTAMRYTGYERKRRRRETRAGGMLVKIGFCMTVFALAILVQAFVLPNVKPNAAVEASSDGSEQETAPEDVLGRLRFVDANSVKSVFAVSQRWSAPVDFSGQSMLHDDTLLQLDSRAGETVSVSAAGEVRAISRDDALGSYIRVHHGSDLESVYYNVDDIRVEVGQPLLAKDTLGKVGGTGVLYVTVTRGGAPQSPSDYLDVPG